MTTEEGKIPANVFVKPQKVPDDTFLFEYSLFFISTLYDFNNAQPDHELVKELYPVCRGQMDITLQMLDENGKMVPEENYPVFVDWSNDFNTDTAGQAEVICVLKQFIAPARETGEEGIGKYEDMPDKISRYTGEHLFDPERPDYSPYGSPIVNSCCHAWSCTPVYLIRKYL